MPSPTTEPNGDEGTEPRSAAVAPVAFVIMDFDDDFQPIYDGIYRSVLEEAGYEISRADTRYESTSIMSEVVKHIEQSDLIIADLTGTNANVYYELGLAHAMGKPVILLIQDLEEMPFDIRPYRVISYSTHFAEVEKDRNELRDAAQRFLKREIKFSSPHADAFNLTVPQYRENNTDYPRRTQTDSMPRTMKMPAANAIVTESDKSELGDADTEPDDDMASPGDSSYDALEPLDHLSALEIGFNQFTEVTEEIGKQADLLNDRMSDVAARIEQGQLKSARDMRIAVLSLANDVDEFSEFLEKANQRYEMATSQTQASVAGAFAMLKISTSDEQEQVLAVIKTTESVEVSIREYKESVDKLAAILNDLPPAVRNFTRAKRRLGIQLARLSANVAAIVGVLTDARRILTETLNPTAFC